MKFHVNFLPERTPTLPALYRGRHTGIIYLVGVDKKPIHLTGVTAGFVEPSLSLNNLDPFMGALTLENDT